MTVLAQPEKAGQIVDVRIALVEVAGLVSAHELLHGEAGTALDFVLQKCPVLILVELDDWRSGFCAILSHGRSLGVKDGIDTGRNEIEPTPTASASPFCPTRIPLDARIARCRRPEVRRTAHPAFVFLGRGRVWWRGSAFP